jgi:hypothetical protein
MATTGIVLGALSLVLLGAFFAFGIAAGLKGP